MKRLRNSQLRLERVLGWYVLGASGKGKSAEEAERAIAGAEIVHGDEDAECAELVKHGLGSCEISHHGDDLQDLVTDEVAEAVVDRLEASKTEAEQDAGFALAKAILNGVVEKRRDCVEM